CACCSSATSWTKGIPSRAANRRPTDDWPAPIIPTMTNGRPARRRTILYSREPAPAGAAASDFAIVAMLPEIRREVEPFRYRHVKPEHLRYRWLASPGSLHHKGEMIERLGTFES